MDERERLLSAIAADPDAVENWIVYADWLTERGDPRGELITLELAIEAGVANAEASERHRMLLRDETAWLSPRLAAESHHVGMTLWRGCIRRAAVFGPRDDLATPETLAALFAEPHACVLRTLHLGYQVDLLEGMFRPAVRELLVDVRWATELLIADTLPSLEMLDLTKGGGRFLDDLVEQELKYLGHPRLRELHGTVRALEIGNFDLPNLDSLHIADPRPLFGPRGILQAPPPRLVHLELEPLVLDTEGPDFVDALRVSPLCAQLRSLAMMDFTLPTLDALARDPSAFSHIAFKGAAWSKTNAERDAVRARIGALFPAAEIEFGSAEDSPPSDEPEPPTTIEPVALQGIGDAVMRLVDKMKARLPKP